jgi:hypothetical protein
MWKQHSCSCRCRKEWYRYEQEDVQGVDRRHKMDEFDEGACVNAICNRSMSSVPSDYMQSFSLSLSDVVHHIMFFLSETGSTSPLSTYLTNNRQDLYHIGEQEACRSRESRRGMQPMCRREKRTK